MTFDPKYLKQMIEGDDLSDPKKLLMYALAAGGGGRSTMPSGSTMYRAGPDDEIQNEGGAFAKSDALYALASNGASSLPPAMNDDEFRLKILKDRINRGEGREMDGTNKNQVKYDKLAEILAGKKKEAQGDRALDIEEGKVEATLAAAQADLAGKQGATSSQQLGNVLKARGDLAGYQPVKNFMDLKPQLEAAIGAMKNGTGLADLELTRLAAQVTDPKTGIRDAEEARFASPSFMQRVENYIGMAKSGQKLQPEQRQELFSLIGRRYQVGRENYNSILDQMAKTTSPFGVSRDQIDVMGPTKSLEEYRGEGSQQGQQGGPQPGPGPDSGQIPPGMKLQRNKRTGETRLVPL